MENRNATHPTHHADHHHSNAHQPLIKVKALWSVSWKFFSKKYKNLATIALPVVTASFLLAMMVELAPLLSSPLAIFIVEICFIISLLCLLVTTFLYIPSLFIEITRIHTEGEHDQYPSYNELLKASYREAIDKFWSYLWIMVLLVAVIFAAYFLFIIPGIFIEYMLAFAVFIFFSEGKKGTDALVTSWKYVQGRWWAVFGRSLLIAIAAIFILIISTAVSGALSFLITRDNSLVYIFGRIFDYFLLVPFVMVYTFQLFVSVRKNNPAVATAVESRQLKRRFLLIFLIGVLFVIAIRLLFPGIYHF